MTRLARVFGALTWLLAGGALLSCGGDDDTASYVEPVYGEPCRFTSCGDHGFCAAEGEQEPSCLCEVGYAGPTCEVCEDGFHRDFYGRCLTDKTCAEQAENPCGANGTCSDAQGVIACGCDEGYEGPRCTLCADRYDRDELDRCLPLFITDPVGDGDGCSEGYTGESCEDCAQGFHLAGGGCIPNETCDATSCPANAICNIVNGKAACNCYSGFLAPACIECMPGTYLEGNRCLPSETCSDDSCPATAMCVVVNGDRTCQCFAEYTGATCSDCASGFHSEQGVCVADQVCGSSSCPPHSTCSVQDGRTACACDAGYTGQQCDQCEASYHLVGTDCVPDETCTSSTCSDHATCVVVGGVARCDCMPGWDGPQCDRCIDLATESTAFEFIQGWPTTVNNCGTRPELSVSRLTVRSQHGADYVQLCARSTFHALNTQHIALTATDQPAELVFWRPVVMLSFDYASVSDMLGLDVVVDGEVRDSLDLAPHFKDSLTLRLDTPSEKIELRARNGQRQTISIDNVVIHYEDCP